MFASPRPLAERRCLATVLRHDTGRRTGAALLALGLVLVGMTPVRAALTDPPHGEPVAEAVPDPAAAYGQLPLSFEANHGQTDPKVKYLTHGRGYDLFITPTETVMALHGSAASPAAAPGEADSPQPTSAAGAALRLSMVGANPDPQVSGAEQLPGRVNYLIGADPAGWHTDIPTYRRVNLTGVYPGVDVTWYGGASGLEYDVVVAPGADPGQVRLAVDGASGPLRLDDDGNLLIDTAAGTVVQHAPVAYQPTGGTRRPVDSSYVLAGVDQVAVTVGAYDATLPLVIDPVLAYSTYLGGGSFEVGFGIAVDATGSAYVGGVTNSADFPTTSGALQTTFGGGAFDAFVSKLNPTGSALVYSTYLRGSSTDIGLAFAIDGATPPNAYVTGVTASADFPTTEGAFDTVLSGIGDAFVTKLNPTGTALVYSTYLGGSSTERGRGIAVDAAGSAYVTGGTISTDFPTTVGAFQATHVGNEDAFVTKLDSTGSALVYSTYLGGATDHDGGGGIALDGATPPNAYVTGDTGSTDFPTTPEAFQTSFAGGDFDAFVTKLNQTGSDLVYSSYLGGAGDDAQIGTENAVGIAVDSVGSAYVSGITNSTDFPTTPAAFQTTFQGGDRDVFVTKVDPTGSALDYSTYLGGSGFDVGGGVAVDGSGSAYVGGGTDSTDFPTTSDAIQPTYAGGASDAFITKLNATGSALVYSTYLGGSGGDQVGSIAVDVADAIYVTGSTGSADFPTTPGAFDTSFNGINDVFVTKIGEAEADLSLAKSCTPDTVVPGSTYTCTLEVTNAGPTDATNVVVTDDLPPGMTVVSGPSGDGFTCSAATSDFTCTKATQPANTTSVITYTVLVPEDIPPETTLENTATVVSDTTDPDPADNTATATTTVVAPPPGQGRVIVTKVVAGTFDLGAAFPFVSDLDGDSGDGVDFTLAAGDIFDSGLLDAGVYSVAELVPPGWELTGVECSDGSPPAAIDVAPGETVTCTFTNELQDDDDDPYDTYDDDPGDPGFDFDPPFDGAGDAGTPQIDPAADVAGTSGIGADAPPSGDADVVAVAGDHLAADPAAGEVPPGWLPELPRTGGPVGAVAVAGVVLVAAGAAAILAGRKRRAATP